VFQNALARVLRQIDLQIVKRSDRALGFDPDPRPAARQWLARPATYRITIMPRVTTASRLSVPGATGSTRRS
jgi:hypothetical protein